MEAHGVCLIPGSACGMPGHVRVCYANLPLEKAKIAAERLRSGLQALAAGAVDLSQYAQPQQPQQAEAGDAASSGTKRPRPPP